MAGDVAEAVLATGPGDDGILVLAAQEGDGEAFSELFRRYHASVRRACARRLSNPVEAEDVAQATFVRAYERIQQCRGDRLFGPWIHAIARSLCTDSFRALAWVEPRAQPLDGRRSHGPNEPEQSILARERAAHVRTALAALPERQRLAVIARDWQGQRPGEIAVRLGLTLGAVDSLLLRARRRLLVAYQLAAGEGA